MFVFYIMHRCSLCIKKIISHPPPEKIKRVFRFVSNKTEIIFVQFAQFYFLLEFGLLMIVNGISILLYRYSFIVFYLSI